REPLMLTLSDFKYALRLMLKSWRFTLLTVVVLGGGLGISLYTFGALHTFVYRDLPVMDGEMVRRVGVGQWPSFGPLDAYELSILRAEADGLVALGPYRTSRTLLGETAAAMNVRVVEAD